MVHTRYRFPDVGLRFLLALLLPHIPLHRLIERRTRLAKNHHTILMTREVPLREKVRILRQVRNIL